MKYAVGDRLVWLGGTIVGEQYFTITAYTLSPLGRYALLDSVNGGTTWLLTDQVDNDPMWILWVVGQPYPTKSTKTNWLPWAVLAGVALLIVSKMKQRRK